jgi:hypothetical protein
MLATAVCLVLWLPVSCRDFNQLFLAEDTPIEACDPTASTYHGYHHFFDRDFLTRDGTLDYRKWFETNRVDASGCDPLRVREQEEAGKAEMGIPTSPPSDPQAPAGPPPAMVPEQAAPPAIAP